jgi:hypothetical protein
VGSFPVFADVHSQTATGTGSYRFSIRAEDLATDDATTLWTVDMSTGTGLIRNAIEKFTDVDWHRIRLKDDTWYRFRRGGVFFGDYHIRRPSGSTAVLDDQFLSTEEGDHYIIVKSLAAAGSPHATGGFELSVTEGARPMARHGHLVWPHGGFVPSLNSSTSFTQNEIQVWSSVPLYLPGVTGPAVGSSQLTTVTLDQWRSLLPSSFLAGAGEVLARQKTGPVWSSWSSIAIYGQAAPTEPGFNGGPALPVTRSFAEGLPSYLVGDPLASDFAVLSASERTAVSTAIRSWRDWQHSSSARFQQVAAGTGNDAATMMVYLAAPDSPVLAVPAGNGTGGDLILNVNSPLMADLTPGSQGYFELLRGLGSVLGVAETTAMGRHVTVMGNRSGWFDYFPWPSTPLTNDFLAIRNPQQQPGWLFNVAEQPTTWLLSGTPFYKTIANTG